MRLWSIHPEYLDAKGLVALWREALLAQNVLLGNTKGYRNHPQLKRFKATQNPVTAIGNYLEHVADEADQRNYNFNRGKIVAPDKCEALTVTAGQVKYEFRHLLNKLALRNPELHRKFSPVKKVRLHPLFIETSGDVEDWEVIYSESGK